MTMLCRCPVFALLLWLSVCGSAYGQSLGKETLAHLDGVQVVVENLPDEAEGVLSVSDIKTNTELQLRQAGVQVYSQEERLAAASSPYLYVNVNLFERDNLPLYAYSIQVSVSQWVVLTSGVSTSAKTYKILGYLGTVGSSSVRRTILDAVEQNIKTFLNDWLEVHQE